MAILNYDGFKKNSTDGFWQVIKNAKGYAVQRKLFDSNTGKELNPTTEYFDLDELKAAQAIINQKNADINALVKEAEGLE